MFGAIFAASLFVGVSSYALEPEFIEHNLSLTQVTLDDEGILQAIAETGDGNIGRHVLQNPVTMKFVPGQNSIYVVEKAGRVRHVTYDVRSDGLYENFSVQADAVIDISDIVSTSVDRGLLGLAIDPDFQSNGHIYLGFTYENDPDTPGFDVIDTSIGGCENVSLVSAPDHCTQLAPKTARVSRFTVVDDFAQRSSEKILLGKIVGSPSQPSCSYFNDGRNVDCIFADSGSHAAPSLDFFRDGTLAVFTGDGAGFYEAELQAFRSMYRDNLSGKVLRIDPDTGEGLADNPYYTGNPNDVESKVWSSGLRNPYGLQIIDTGNNFIGEPVGGMVGWNQVESILHVPESSFMGWACFSYETTLTHYQYFCIDNDAKRPKDLDGNDMSTTPAALVYRHQEKHNYAAAVAGGALLTSDIYGDLKGKYAFADYRIGEMYMGDFSSDYKTLTVPRESPGGDDAPLIPFTKGGLGAPVAFITAPNGIVYIVDIFAGRIDGTNYGSIVELGMKGNDQPLRSEAIMTINTPSEDMFAREFICADSMIHVSAQVTCRWDFGDGDVVRVGINESTTHHYDDPGVYGVTLTLEASVDEILASISDNVIIVDFSETVLAEPYLDGIDLPGNPIAVSQSFDVTVHVGNAGSNRPFYVMLNVFSELQGEVEAVRSQYWISSSDNTAILAHTFENLIFRDEGRYNFFISYIHTDDEGVPITGATGNVFAGSMIISGRSGNETDMPVNTDGEGIDIASESVCKAERPSEDAHCVVHHQKWYELCTGDASEVGGLNIDRLVYKVGVRHDLCYVPVGAAVPDDDNENVLEDNVISMQCIEERPSEDAHCVVHHHKWYELCTGDESEEGGPNIDNLIYKVGVRHNLCYADGHINDSSTISDITDEGGNSTTTSVLDTDECLIIEHERHPERNGIWGWAPNPLPTALNDGCWNVPVTGQIVSSVCDLHDPRSEIYECPDNRRYYGDGMPLAEMPLAIIAE